MKTLEKKLSSLLPLKHFLLTGYARNGLFLLIKALECKHDHEIIIPAFTCSIIPITIKKAGAIPIPVDCEEKGLNIDPKKIEKAITTKTRAIYVVHTYGTIAKIEQICNIANKYNLFVIEDLAQSLFSQYKRKQVGTFGHFAILSFSKKIINFEGGAIGTNDTIIYKKILCQQKIYQKNRLPKFGNVVDIYGRLLGSTWESRFGFPTLLVFKVMDFFNDIIYKGSYGLSVDSNKFIMHNLAKRLTIWQIDSLFSKNVNNDYSLFEKSCKNITLAELNQNSDDSLPAYYSGILKKQSPFFNFLSFRSWHNFNTLGKYPRADYLYSNYRIFSKIIKIF